VEITAYYYFSQKEKELTENTKGKIRDSQE
jgi:hypothetical protein